MLDFTQLLHQTKERKRLLSIVVFSFLECPPVPENSNDCDDKVTEKAPFLAEHRAQEIGKERRGTESSTDASSSNAGVMMRCDTSLEGEEHGCFWDGEGVPGPSKRPLGLCISECFTESQFSSGPTEQPSESLHTGAGRPSDIMGRAAYSVLHLNVSTSGL